MLIHSRLQDTVAILGMFTAALGFFWLLNYLTMMEQSLICIDRNTIRKTSWLCGKGNRIVLNRPDKILFEKRDGQWHLVAKKGRIPLRIRGHELRWIREIIEQFENEIPTLSPENNLQTTTNSVAKNIESDRCAIDDMEYQGQKLRQIPNPLQQQSDKKITKTKFSEELPTGTLCVCCSKCNSLLPTDYVLTDTALAQCPYCGFLFEIADLKRHTVPQHSNTEIQADENVLKVHQRPRFFGIPFFIVLVIACIDISIVFLYIQIIWQINPAATLQDINIITPDGKFTTWIQTAIMVHIFSFLFFVWSIFLHRFIEFRRNEVYFCIRWLCFWWSWTIPRNRLGACQLTFFTLFFNVGMKIPYGKKYFYIGTKNSEIPHVVGEINHWLITHPPDEFSISDNFPKFENSSSDNFLEKPNKLTIGGVAEINDKEICWCCCDCGHRFLTEELDFPNRTAFCPNCNKIFNLSQLRHYALEPLSSKPELPQLSINESETEQRIEFLSSPIKISKKILFWIFWAILISFLFGVGIMGIITILRSKDFISILFMMPSLLLISSPYLLIFFRLFLIEYDGYRQRFTAWTTRFSDGYFELTRRYKNYSETIRIENNRIAQFQRGSNAKNFGESIMSYLFFGRFPSNLESRGQIRNKIFLTDGTTIYLPILPESKNNCGWNDWLVNTWNEQLHQHR
jgi:hypothetical protein